jgi:hypothetical protein
MLESAQLSVVINPLLTRVHCGTRQHRPFYQPPCRFFRGFLEFRYHREIRGHPQKTRKILGFCRQGSAEKQALSRNMDERMKWSSAHRLTRKRVREIGLSGEHARRFAGPGDTIVFEVANVR